MKKYISISDHKHARKLERLKNRLKIQETLVRRLLNGDDEEYVSPPPKKPDLKVVE